MELGKRVKNWVFGAGTAELLALFFAVAVLAGLFVYGLIASASKTLELYAVMLAIGVALFITRSIEPWEWGIEMYHILIFGVALEFGLLVPTVLNIATLLLVPVHQMMDHPYKHYLVKSLPGPMIQSGILLITTLIFGLMGKYMYNAVTGNIVFYYLLTITFADYFIGNILRKTFTPLEPFRLLIYSTMGFAFNYYLITNYGAGLIAYLHALR